MVLTLGAGNVSHLGPQILEKLGQRSPAVAKAVVSSAPAAP
jgi:hypothetical protein